jgi:DNA repair exonuclease SbcCD ATPase subunit
MGKLVLAACAAPCLILLGGPAFAADSEVEQLRAQLRSTVLQLRELQDQQAAAAAPAPAPGAPDAATKAKLAAAQSDLRAARARTSELQASLAKAQAGNDASASASAAQTAELERTRQALSQANDTLRDVTAERNLLNTQLSAAKTLSAACQAKNDRLVAFTQGVLDADRKAGLGSALRAKEPVFGFRRVQLENLAQERDDTVRANRCDPRLDAAAKPRPTGG